MSKALKKQMASELSKDFVAVESFLVFNYQGLNSLETHTLRKLFYDNKLTAKVVKNKLATFALGEKFPKEIKPLFKGPIAMVYGGDIVRVSQILLEWNKKAEKKLDIKGGYIPGKVLSPKDVEMLAKVPARPVMLSIMAGAFQSPAQKMATITLAPMQKVSYSIQALVQKMEDKKVDKVSDAI